METTIGARRRFDRGGAAVAVSAVAFGTYGVLSKGALQAGITPLCLLCWRFGLAALALWLLARCVRESAIPRAARLPLCALGVAYALMAAAYVYTVKTAGVSYAVLLLYAYPVVVALIDRLHGNRLKPLRLLACACAVVGVALLVGGPRAGISAAGIAVGLASALAYGVYIFYGSGVMRDTPAIGGAAAILGAAFAVLLLPALFLGGIIPPAGGPLWLVAIALAATALPVALLGAGMRVTGAARAAILGTLEPLTAVALAALLFGEHVGAGQMPGAVLIAAATALSVTA